jgi:hypothetical protein
LIRRGRIDIQQLCLAARGLHSAAGHGSHRLTRILGFRYDAEQREDKQHSDNQTFSHDFSPDLFQSRFAAL